MIPQAAAMFLHLDVDFASSAVAACGSALQACCLLTFRPHNHTIHTVCAPRT